MPNPQWLEDQLYGPAHPYHIAAGSRNNFSISSVSGEPGPSGAGSGLGRATSRGIAPARGRTVLPPSLSSDDEWQISKDPESEPEPQVDRKPTTKSISQHSVGRTEPEPTRPEKRVRADDDFGWNSSSDGEAAPGWGASGRAMRKRQRMEQQMTEGLRLMAASLRAGRNFAGTGVRGAYGQVFGRTQMPGRRTRWG